MAVQSRVPSLHSSLQVSPSDVFTQRCCATAALAAPTLADVLDKQNVSSLAALLKDTDMLPDRYVIPECHRPRLSHDAFSAEVELPVIDFAKLRTASLSEELVREVGSACKDWGFFQIVNHGVPHELINKMETQAKRFFALPHTRKEKAAIFPRPLGYNGRYADMSSSAPWIEALAMQQTPASTVDSTLSKVWPDGNAEFRRLIAAYHAEMERLGSMAVQLVSLSLDLERCALSRHFEKSSTTLRWNHYPPCPSPAQALGLHAHSDPAGLTILHQDNVGGLQIKKDGRWIAVKPRSEAFIVNLGDLMQAWTNGRYRSVEHRAVVNRERSRLSMVFFYGPQEDIVIRPPNELVDEEHPLQYRPFTWDQYSKARLRIDGQGKSHIDVFAGLAL